MATLNYDDIYSRFFMRVEAYDLVDEHLTDDQVHTFLRNWLHASIGKPYIRRLFDEIGFDDLMNEFTYTMKYSIDEYSDEEFVIDILSMGMVIEWIEPKVNSITNIAQMFGSKEEKFFSEANHLKQLQNLRQDMRRLQRRTIADRGYIWNSYLDGDAT